jgi:hypothetical protein
MVPLPDEPDPELDPFDPLLERSGRLMVEPPLPEEPPSRVMVTGADECGRVVVVVVVVGAGSSFGSSSFSLHWASSTQLNPQVVQFDFAITS